MRDTDLIPFGCDGPENPWGVGNNTNAKVQFCEITCKGWRDKPEGNCPWMHTPQNVYLLVGKHGAQTYVQEGEKKWSDILPPEQLAVMEKERELVLGYVVGEKVDKTVRIHWIQSFVRRIGVMKQILSCIENGAIEGTDEYAPWEIEEAPQDVKDIWAKYGWSDGQKNRGE